MLEYNIYIGIKVLFPFSLKLFRKKLQTTNGQKIAFGVELSQRLMNFYSLYFYFYFQLLFHFR